MEKEVNEIKKKIFKENSLSLRISRVPEETKKQFIELANKEFVGDYGMTLKWLMMERWNKLMDHELRISRLESKVEGKKQITTVGGKKITVR